MKLRVNTSIAVAAAFAAALSTIPAASQAALVQQPSAAIALSAQTSLQPSAAVLDRLNALSTTYLIRGPWDQAWVELGPPFDESSPFVERWPEVW